MKKTLISIFIFITLFTVCAVALAGEDNNDFGTGLIWESPEKIGGSYQETPPIEGSLPSSVDLAGSFPLPGNQGAQNSCVAWAVSYALRSHQEQLRQEWGLNTDEHLFSPSYTYNIISNGTDNGSTLTSIMDILRERGVCTLASFPYSDVDCATQPTHEQNNEALNYRIRNYYTVRGIENIKSSLAHSDGVVVAFDVYPDFRSLNPSNPIYDTAEGMKSGSHAVCLVGYDDEKSAFKFINSWGKKWGLDGYGWISYELLSDCRVNYYISGEAVGFVIRLRGTDEYTEGFFDYTVANGEAQICNYFGTDKYVTIPGMLGGYPVTSIGNDAFMRCDSIKGVVLPDSIKYIGSRAFKSCGQLENIRIPDNVIQIGDEAFANCNSMSSATIPDSVTHIGVHAFHLTDDFSGNSTYNPNVKLICSEDSCAHKYADANNLYRKIVDFRDKVILTTVLDNDASVLCGSIVLTYTSDNTCSLYPGYVPLMDEIPIFIVAVYEENKIKKVYVSDDEEAIDNVSAEDLENCKMFVWTKNLQPCIEVISGDNMQYQYLY